MEEKKLEDFLPDKNSSYIKEFNNSKIITKINQHQVSISYVLRVKDYNPEGIINTEQEVAITYVNLTGRFDQDKLPQIASHIGLS